MIVKPTYTLMGAYRMSGRLRFRILDYLTNRDRPVKFFGVRRWSWLRRRPSNKDRRMIALFNRFMLWDGVQDIGVFNLANVAGIRGFVCGYTDRTSGGL